MVLRYFLFFLSYAIQLHGFKNIYKIMTPNLILLTAYSTLSLDTCRGLKGGPTKDMFTFYPQNLWLILYLEKDFVDLKML